ncbi:hypothetical protein PVAG01_11151 [Phlyctema vagabunda]|uniref:Uncharacterized protein n=1 Tax=Phlyctema vagabunda TaxID=108571 RepID=A0ABR4P1H2_9HELO
MSGRSLVASSYFTSNPTQTRTWSSSSSVDGTRQPRGGTRTDETAASTSQPPSPPPPLSHPIQRSRPIAIELPSPAYLAARKKSLPVYTPEEPLSARGDLPGGYFPLHEDPATRSHIPHPFHHSPAQTMSSSSSVAMSPSRPDATPRTSCPPPGTLTMPMGKYHPSNYKITPVGSPAPTTTNLPANLALPSPSTNRKPTQARHHHRKESEVRRKIQQYQRDMIAQARLASASTPGAASLMSKPISPRLLPLGSPDELSAAMTPLELGDGSGGYLGARALSTESRESEMVGQMMRMEEERRRREGQSSPVTRV